MEKLLHYVWKHRLFPLTPLATVDGSSVEVVDPGLQNTQAGPDFFNAKVRIGGTLWAGNVEIHDRASDWQRHHHERDARYGNIILHVCGVVDAEPHDYLGRALTQLQLDVPASVTENYRRLLAADRYPPCHEVIARLPRLTVHSWMNALQTERLERKTTDIEARAGRSNGDWEAAFFATLARNYGFGINGEAFEQWAASIPLGAAAHHRDNLLQIEALFLGQSGLLTPQSVPGLHNVEGDAYYRQLCTEYAYLTHKFGLQPIDYKCWRFLRLRPQNFPHVRLARLAALYVSRQATLSNIMACTTVREAGQALQAAVSPYWETHHAFGSESARSERRLSAASVNLLLINTVIPMLFAYGRHRADSRLCERALAFLDELKAEDNRIVRMWRDCGMPVETAGDTQALIQLKNEYCDRKDCLRCRIGYEYLKH